MTMKKLATPLSRLGDAPKKYRRKYTPKGRPVSPARAKMIANLARACQAAGDSGISRLEAYAIIGQSSLPVLDGVLTDAAGKGFLFWEDNTIDGRCAGGRGHSSVRIGLMSGGGHVAD